MKRRIRVLLVESFLPKDGSRLMSAMKAMEDVELVAAVDDGLEAYKLIQKEALDLVLMDLIIANMDGLEILQRVRETNKTPPVFVICSALTTETIINEALYLGASYFLPRTASSEWCARRSVEIYREVIERDIVVGGRRIDSFTVRRHITQLLMLVGVPAATKGYSYLKTALYHTVRDPEMIHSMTTKLYPMVAKLSDSNESAVERTIRCTIENTWDRGDLNIINELFGNTVRSDLGRPTNAEFIARMTDVLLMHM